MPTYEYECKDCGYKFEAFQKMSDPAIKLCPKCKKETRRLIGIGAGIIFKGPGFYATDYRKKEDKKDEKKKSDNCSDCPSVSECNKDKG
jgi:putative FmdB family regulatory protein